MNIYDAANYDAKQFGLLKSLRIMPSANCIWLISYNTTDDFIFRCIGSQSKALYIDLSAYHHHLAVIFNTDTVYFNKDILRPRPSLLRNQLTTYQPQKQNHANPFMFIFAQNNSNSANGHIELLLQYIQQYKQSCFISPAFKKIHDIVVNVQGNILLQEIADKCQYSPRHIHRMFQEYLGFGPKTFCKYIRFQKVLREIFSNPNRQNSEFILNLGYSDQAHFQREFKTFVGETPRHFCIKTKNLLIYSNK